MIFFKALLAGLAIAAPMGPINMICIQQTLRFGLWGFFVVAAGAGFANITLSGLAASGSIALFHFLEAYARYLHVLGGCLLIGFGIKAWLKEKTSYTFDEKPHLLGLFFQVLSVGLANPMTILGYMSLMVELTGDMHQPGMVLSVMLGLSSASVAWRICLGVTVMQLKKRNSIQQYFRYLDILCPLCFFYFGISALFRAMM